MKALYSLLVVLLFNLLLPVNGAIPVTFWNATACSNGTGSSVYLSSTSCAPLTLGSRSVWADTECDVSQGTLILFLYNSSSCSNTVGLGYLTYNQPGTCNSIANQGLASWSAVTSSTSCTGIGSSDSFMILPSFVTYALLMFAIINLSI